MFEIANHIPPFFLIVLLLYTVYFLKKSHEEGYELWIPLAASFLIFLWVEAVVWIFYWWLQ